MSHISFSALATCRSFCENRSHMSTDFVCFRKSIRAFREHMSFVWSLDLQPAADHNVVCRPWPTQGTPQVQFANIRTMVLYQGLPYCLRLCIDQCNDALHVMPKVSTQVYILDRKIWKLFRPHGNG